MEEEKEEVGVWPEGLGCGVMRRHRKSPERKVGLDWGRSFLSLALSFSVYPVGMISAPQKASLPIREAPERKQVPSRAHGGKPRGACGLGADTRRGGLAGKARPRALNPIHIPALPLPFWVTLMPPPQFEPWLSGL